MDSLKINVFDRKVQDNLNIRKKNIFIKKISAIILFLFVWFFIRVIYIKEDEGVTDGPYCFNDKMLTVILAPVTDFLSQHVYLRFFLLIFASNALDIGLFTFWINHIFKGNSWKHILAYILFYGARSVLQGIFLMQIYDKVIFTYPDFPSVVVPYQRTTDFFYSGHTGCAFILSLAFRDYGYTILYYVFIFVTFLEGSVMLIYRTHYSIDVIFGFIAAHYSYIISAKLSKKYLDKYIPICGETKDVKPEVKKVESVQSTTTEYSYDKISNF